MVVVLGGGLAGLAAAKAVAAPLYEAADSLGGIASSKNVDGFIFDHGIHVLQTSHAEVQGMFKSAGVTLGKQQRNAHIFSHDTYTAYPFQVNTAGLPLGLRLRCLYSYFTRDRRGTAENYEQWIHQNIGSGFGETFLIPYSEKFWTIHPREMTSEWTGNRIPAAKPWHVLRGALVNKQTPLGTNAVFEYPTDGGFGRIPELLAATASNTHTNHRATSVDVDRKVITFQNGKQVNFSALISTIPLPELVRIIPQAPQRVRDAAARLRCNSIVVVNIGIDHPNISQKHWIHFPEKDVAFFRISYPSNLGPATAPAGTSSIAAEVAYSPEKPIDKATIIDRVIDDLIRVRAMSASHKVIVRDMMDIKYGYVIYDHHRRESVRTIRRWLRSVDVFPTGRYGLWAYLWSHEALLSGHQTALRLRRVQDSPDASDHREMADQIG